MKAKCSCFFLSLLGLVLGFLVSETALISAGTFGQLGVGLHRDVKSFKELKEKNVVIQMTRYTCGAAALATIVNYYLGGKTTEDQVMDMTGEFDLTEEERRALDPKSDMTLHERGETLKGTVRAISLLGLRRAADSLGYKAVGYRMKLEHLLKLDRPVLIHTHFRGRGHFSVLKGIRGRTVFLACPSLGNITMSVGRFMKMWQGVVMSVTPRDGSIIEDHLLEIGFEYERAALGQNTGLLLNRPSYHLLDEITLRQIRNQ